MILGVESSCDESALAVFDPSQGIVWSVVHSQLDIHREFGGVVPDLAAREHLGHFSRLFLEFRRSIDPNEITQVAVTRGPGLAGCLAVGIAAAKGFSIYNDCPIVGVNHLVGHAWSPFLGIHTAAPSSFREEVDQLLPHLGLIVSGGNTLLFRIEKDLELSILAETRDDAAGEALDKGAKLLGLPYPGGVEIERLAQEGNPRAFQFPRAFADSTDRAFSFSGVKTSLRYRLEKMDSLSIKSSMNDLCASYQEAVVDALCRKVEQVLKGEETIRSLGLSGGVANNRSLRSRFTAIGEEKKLPALIADPELTGDNAAMIAFAAFADSDRVAEDGDSLSFEPSLQLTE
ncbi:MAG: tRNA (adenosine(37)-N6)-threonylcarbamoyltransferase complex transferase subunit TsaD [Verrucomicrobiota bacterium]